MDQDIRNSEAFQEAKRLLEEIYRPGQGYISDIADLQLSSDASQLLFTGTVVENLDGPRTTRIFEVDLKTAAIQTLTFGPNSDCHARISADGTTIAFLSDRNRPSDFQFFLLDVQTRTVTPGPSVEGWVEYFEWSPDGRRILLGVAGYGAELSTGQGSYKTAEVQNDAPSWMPRVTGSSSESLWRKAWIWEIETKQLSCASPRQENIWEATWCGGDKLTVVTSSEPQEGAWYGAELSIIELSTGNLERLYTPTSQIALPRASPSGRYVAFIEAISSDRGYVAGDLRVYDLHNKTCTLIETRMVDTTYLEWSSDNHILIAGHRGFEIVVLSIAVEEATSKELWQSTHVSTPGRYATVLGLHHPEEFALVFESFFQRPQIATVKHSAFEIAKTSMADPERTDDSGDVEAVRWQAPDGLQMEGWLLRPKCKPPYATITDVHGGPVLHWRPYWLGRAASNLMLIRRSYAIFLPNPRGSSGRGQAFAARVVGDVAGADTADYLSGIDHLVKLGIADPSRLAVTGLSYGGFMTCWLTTQDARFGAAISVGPATNHVTQHLLGNIPQFASLFLQDHYTNLAGMYYSRSPILHAHKSQTPTLLVCGDLDQCTPAEEGIQYHNALLENGVDSILVRYPEEGHGVRGTSAAIDFAARSVMWFERYIPARGIDDVVEQVDE